MQTAKIGGANFVQPKKTAGSVITTAQIADVLNQFKHLGRENWTNQWRFRYQEGYIISYAGGEHKRNHYLTIGGAALLVERYTGTTKRLTSAAQIETMEE